MITPLITGCAAAFLALLPAAVIATEPGSAPTGPANSYPGIRLSNHILNMELYLPDGASGYYRSSRFDWSGLIARVTYKGHAFYGPWQDPHDPMVTDAVLGPAEEYGMQTPLGFEEAKAGDSFFKIGVGALKRPGDGPYQFWKPYDIVRVGEWKITHGANWVQFEQVFHGDRGWAYDYTKRIELADHEPVFTIKHTLKNIGSKAIDTTVYCHNFTLIDDEPIGPSYLVTMPFNLVPKQPNSPPAVIEGQTIRHEDTIAPGKATYFEFQDVPSAVSDNVILIKNQRTGAAIRVEGSEPMVDFHFYGSRLAACPEPFTAVKVAPGAEQRWQSKYTLSVASKP